ncbi:hypothetical protein ALCH109712_11695 [Alkalicoccus chagannorensis]
MSTAKILPFLTYRLSHIMQPPRNVLNEDMPGALSGRAGSRIRRFVPLMKAAAALEACTKLEQSHEEEAAALAARAAALRRKARFETHPEKE